MNNKKKQADVTIRHPPVSFWDISIKKIKLFRKVYMGIDMVLTEAVISRTAGAVTELELWKLGIGPAADGTFMRIKLAALFLPDPA